MKLLATLFLFWMIFALICIGEGFLKLWLRRIKS